MFFLTKIIIIKSIIISKINPPKIIPIIKPIFICFDEELDVNLIGEIDGVVDKIDKVFCEVVGKFVCEVIGKFIGEVASEDVSKVVGKDSCIVVWEVITEVVCEVVV